MKSYIARKLILYTILFSSVITLIITAVQLYTEFKYEVKDINQKLEQIKVSYRYSIAHSAWLLDINQLKTILDGITELPDIAYASVKTSDEQLIESGRYEHQSSENIEFKLPIVHLYNGKNITIGEFQVTASLSGVYNRLLNRLWVILLSNALKTSLVAIFVYFLFSWLVTRHLTKISEFSKAHNAFDQANILTLDRKADRHDELDTVVNAINEMHTRLNEKIQEISHQKQYLSLTLNSIGDAVITTDEKGYITRLNPVAEKLTGWKNEEAYKQPVQKVFSIVDASTGESLRHPFDKVINSGEIIHLSNHTTLIAKDGRQYQIADSAAPICDNDKILGMVLVFNDVTEQYQMREALFESEQRFRQLADNLNEVFWLCSSDWQSFIYISPVYEKKWGMSIKAVYEQAQLWFDCIDATERQDVLLMIERFDVRHDKFINFNEYRITNTEGETFWIKARAYPVFDSEGKLVRIAGIAEDITARKLANENIRRAQKMDALGKLTGGIAHDYNNMLGVALGYADLLHNCLTEPRQKKYMQHIIHACERGAKLTKKLLAFSRNTSSEVNTVNINEQLLETAQMLEKTLTSRIRLELKLSDELWPVCLDASDLEDAVLNICINAMQAIENTGLLIISTANQSLSDVQSQALGLESGDYVCLSIEDNGQGMDEQTREQIFDPFYSTKGENGTGLGLTQVYSFIKRCHGAIQVDSKTGVGSCFKLFFPRCRDLSTADSQPNLVCESGQELKGKETILLVDDEVALLDLVTEILTQHGYQVLQANHAQKALDILSQKRVHLIITDVIMPDINGYELVQSVKELYPQTRVLIVSGYNDKMSTQYSNSEFEVLQKPFNAQLLLEHVKTVLQG